MPSGTTISLDPEFVERYGTGDTLRDWEAETILEERLRAIGFNARDFGLLHIAIPSYMLTLIPEENWTAELLQRVDLRPLLQPLLRQGFAPRPGADQRLNGKIISPEVQRAAASALQTYTESLRGEYMGAAIATGVPPEEAAMYAGEILAEYDPNAPVAGQVQAPTAVVVPSTGDILSGEPTSGETQAPDDFASMLDDIRNGGTGTAPPAFLTPEDLAFMFRTDDPEGAINAYLTDLSNRSLYEAETGQAAPADPTLVDFGGLAPTERAVGRVDTSSLSGIEDASTNFGRAYRLTEALTLPYEMSPEQIAALTRKMKNAGIFAQIGSEPTIKGDASDPVFRRAYKMLLGKSLAERRPIEAVLRDGQIAYEVNQEEMIRARLTDPARIRLASDALGRDILGRKLSKREQQQLVQMVHSLQTQQARDEGPDGTGSITDIDWEARMIEQIRANNPDEAAAADMADQYDVFRSFLAGP